MFYADQILAKKGPLAKVWLAAHWERKLSKTQFLQTNIPSSISAIVEDYGQPMALRLSGQLLLGVVRIFSRKTRYLLEDCNEALVKIKMAFRPGVVDLTDEQAVAATGTITMAEAINEFDILMPEQLDLNEILARSSVSGTPTNTSRVQDITLQSDSNYLSFSQNLADEIDLGLGDYAGSRNDMDSLEIGRDANRSQVYTPGSDMPRFDREKSLQPPDPLLIQDPSFDLGLDNNAGDVNPLGMDFDFNDDFGTAPEGDLKMPESFEPVPLDFEVPIHDLQSADISTFDENNAISINIGDEDEPVVTKRKRAARVPKKRKAQVDSAIEISAQEFKRQLENTKDIESREKFIPRSELAIQFNVAKSSNPYGYENIRLLKKFSIRAPLLTPKLKVARLLTTLNRSAEEIERFNSSFQAPAVAEADFQFNDDFGDAPDYSAIQFEGDVTNTSGSMLKRSRMEMENNFDESIIFGDEQQGLDLTFEQEENPEQVKENSMKTLNLLEGRFKDSDEKSVSFFSLTESTSRVETAKLFFEILVLKTMNVIDVDQPTPYGDITLLSL